MGRKHVALQRLLHHLVRRAGREREHARQRRVPRRPQPVDVRGVMPLTVAALAVSTCSRACAISPSARSSARRAASRADAALRRRTEASRRQLREKSSSAFADGGVSARRDDEVEQRLGCARQEEEERQRTHPELDAWV